jgi:hypothetical protein
VIARCGATQQPSACPNAQVRPCASTSNPDAVSGPVVARELRTEHAPLPWAAALASMAVQRTVYLALNYAAFTGLVFLVDKLEPVAGPGVDA